jgi:type IV pilus assembly protein PilC
MPSYSYEAKQPTGEMRRGLMEAATAEVVQRRLEAQGYQVLRVEPVLAPVVHKPWEPIVRRLLAPVLFPVNSKALANFFLSLKVMLSAGMTMAEAMTTLVRQTRNATLQRAAREIAEAAIRGVPMSRVARKYPSAFGPATLAALEAAEESGMTEIIADRLSKYYDRVFQLEMTYRWQTFYPKLLLIAIIIIPTAQTLFFHGFNAWLSVVLARALPLLAAITCLWYGWRLLLQLPGISIGLDRMKLIIPWFGSLARRMATARWARALSMLSAAGVPVHRALVAAAAASGNKAMESALVREAQGVLRGRSLSEVIRSSREIPESAVDLIAVSERAGSIESALDKIADYYESETDVGGKQTAMTVGLLLYLILAAIIGFIVISFYGNYFAGITKALGE